MLKPAVAESAPRNDNSPMCSMVTAGLEKYIAIR
jgi:hypothetical protein